MSADGHYVDLMDRISATKRFQPLNTKRNEAWTQTCTITLSLCVSAIFPSDQAKECHVPRCSLRPAATTKVANLYRNGDAHTCTRHRCDYLAAAGEVIAGNDPPAWMKEKMDWLKRQSLERCSGSAAAVLRTSQHSRSGSSGTCLLSLPLQPLRFPGLQRRLGRRLTHRFGRD